MHKKKHFCLIFSISLSLLISYYLESSQDLVLEVPYVKQEKNFCGPASLAMVLMYWGSTVSQYEIGERVQNKEKKGVWGEDLKSVAENLGFNAFIYSSDINNIKENLSKGRPIIVPLTSGSSSNFHFVLIVGVSSTNSKLIYHDPAEESFSVIDIEEFITKWKPSNYWALLVVPK